MKDTLTRREPSDDSSSDPLAPTDSSVITPDSEATDESDSASSPSAAPVDADTKTPRMTEAEWEASVGPVPIHRVPRESISHMFKGDLFGPRRWVLEPKRKYVRPDWVQIFREAEERFRKAAADEARKTEGSK